MGAIVGGLYSIGYTPQQLDSMVNAQNWKFLLLDAPNPKDVLLDDRLKSERYVLSIPFSLKSAAVSDAGIIKGKNLARLFSTLKKVTGILWILAVFLFRLPGVAVDREIPVDSQIAAPAIRENKLNVGFRFDTEELAALQANTDFYFGRQRESLVSLTARLGKRTLARLGYSYQWDGGWQAGLAYQFDYKDMNIYNEGKRALDLTFTHQLVRMGAAKDWNNIQVSLGIDFDYYHYHDLLSLDPLASALFENSSLFSYFAGLVFNNLNERSAPTKGMSWAVSYHLYTDNFFQYKDNNLISVFDARWQGCFSPSSKLTVTPSFYGRVLSGSDNYPFAIINM